MVAVTELRYCATLSAITTGQQLQVAYLVRLASLGGDDAGTGALMRGCWARLSIGRGRPLARSACVHHRRVAFYVMLLLSAL